MIKIIVKISIFSIFYINLYADDIGTLANRLNLDAGTKAIVQWERVFQFEKKMKRYKIDKLSKENQRKLKKYLIDHAIDSDKPLVAGV